MKLIKLQDGKWVNPKNVLLIRVQENACSWVVVETTTQPLLLICADLGEARRKADEIAELVNKELQAA